MLVMSKFYLYYCCLKVRDIIVCIILYIVTSHPLQLFFKRETRYIVKYYLHNTHELKVVTRKDVIKLMLHKFLQKHWPFCFFFRSAHTQVESAYAKWCNICRYFLLTDNTTLHLTCSIGRMLRVWCFCTLTLFNGVLFKGIWFCLLDWNFSRPDDRVRRPSAWGFQAPSQNGEVMVRIILINTLM